MKKLLIGAGLILASLGFAQKTEAQIRVGIHINIGDQPSWRVPGYDYVEYYYLPDIECYYYVPRHQFIYLSNGRWVFSASLPGRCRDYDLYSGYKVVVNRPNAYDYFDQDRQRYGKRNEHHDNGRHLGWYKHHGGGHHDR
ncbi:MAG TPA: hypothetical protein VIV35_07570 [Chitinophagaceae bacterium]